MHSTESCVGITYIYGVALLQLQSNRVSSSHDDFTSTLISTLMGPFCCKHVFELLNASKSAHPQCLDRLYRKMQYIIHPVL